MVIVIFALFCSIGAPQGVMAAAVGGGGGGGLVGGGGGGEGGGGGIVTPIDYTCPQGTYMTGLIFPHFVESNFTDPSDVIANCSPATVTQPFSAPIRTAHKKPIPSKT